VIYGKVPPGVNSRTGVTAVSESQGGAIFSLMGDNIKLCGRGIIDGSLCPAHTRNIISVCGTNVSLEGVVVRDASTWTIPIRASEHVTVKNIKIFGWRGNSDGVDICNSRHVRVTHSFLRTMDDLVVIKTPVKGAGESRDITVTGCVLWNELAQALNIGAELRENVEDVHFSDCDIIHDRGREWLLRVYNCDGGDVHDVTFENIRANDAKRLISLWIGTAKWSKDAERGHIENITFKNIQAAGANMSVDLKGWDSQHEIRDVHFQKVLTNGHPLKLGEINRNAFVQDVRVTP
jgi:polygalacturonase